MVLYTFITIAWFRTIICSPLRRNIWCQYEIPLSLSHTVQTNEQTPPQPAWTYATTSHNNRRKTAFRLIYFQVVFGISYFVIWFDFPLFERTDFCHKHKLENSHSRHKSAPNQLCLNQNTPNSKQSTNVCHARIDLCVCVVRCNMCMRTDIYVVVYPFSV